jgi:nucleotide-binding universal stress UspA family protein
VLAVPAFSALQRPLLAYDGSDKAQEALFMATYLAGRWQLPLTVITVGKNGTAQAMLDKARAYLEEKEVTAEFILKTDDTAISILLAAEKNNCDFIIMGGYSSNTVLDLIVGSTVDKVLRNATCPVLICR